MAYYLDDDARPVTRITAGAVGEPGRRTFILQAQYGEEVVSWVIDKVHAAALGRGIPRLLDEVRSDFPELEDPLVAAEPSLDLRDPLMPEFRVATINLDYDRLHDLVVLTLVDGVEDDLDGSLEEALGGPLELQVYATRGQAFLLARRVEEVVSAGRPTCPLCGEPIDDFGHFCMPAGARHVRGGMPLH
jgi:uncharacterized repeat protein (TIGR03847 family)